MVIYSRRRRFSSLPPSFPSRVKQPKLPADFPFPFSHHRKQFRAQEGREKKRHLIAASCPPPPTVPPILYTVYYSSQSGLLPLPCHLNLMLLLSLSSPPEEYTSAFSVSPFPSAVLYPRWIAPPSAEPRAQERTLFH